ncbi:MAG: alpha/beta hydrolase [Hyphomicrobiales bacterium]|nr:alpha/beta hydrolase [Hyphomicrobiales bacterium]
MRHLLACSMLFLSLLAPITARGQSARISAPTESGLVTLSDSHIEYFSQGQGEPIVLIPGANLTAGYLEGLAQAFATSGYRVVRINFRGAGKSEGPEDGVTLHTLAADVAGVLEALQLGPSNIVGHAFGNRVARQLVADRPDLVHAVVLLAAGGKIDPQPAAAGALRTFFNPVSTDADSLDAIKFMVGDPADAEMVWRVIKPCLAPRAWAIEYKAAVATPLKDWWAPPGMTKYLVVQGTKDEIAPAKNGELLKQELGERVTLVSINGAGHLSLVTEPQKVAVPVISFLQTLQK